MIFPFKKLVLLSVSDESALELEFDDIPKVYGLACLEAPDGDSCALKLVGWVSHATSNFSVFS